MSIYYVLGAIIGKMSTLIEQTIQHGKTMNKMNKYIVY